MSNEVNYTMPKEHQIFPVADKVGNWPTQNDVDELSARRDTERTIPQKAIESNLAAIRSVVENRRAYNPVTHYINAFGDLVEKSYLQQADEQREACKPAPKPIGLAGDAATRKASPIASGVLFYFPNALAAVAALSKVGNDQHNPGQPMHWAFNKSTDEADCILRHEAEAGTVDTDGVRHSTKVAWRALAQLERELLTAHPELQPGKNVKGFKR